jgi:hypothetical protein
MCRLLVEAVRPATLDGLETYTMVEQLEMIRVSLATRTQDERTWRSQQIHDHRGDRVLFAVCAFLHPLVPVVRLNDDNAVLFDGGGAIYGVQCYYPGASDVRVKATRFAFAGQVQDVGGTADVVLLRLADIGSTPKDPFERTNTFPGGRNPFLARLGSSAESGSVPDGLTMEDKGGGMVVSFQEGSATYQCTVAGGSTRESVVKFCDNLKKVTRGQRLDGFEVFRAVQELAGLRRSIASGSLDVDVTWDSAQLARLWGETLTVAVMSFVLGGGRAIVLAAHEVIVYQGPDRVFSVCCTAKDTTLTVHVRRMVRQRRFDTVGNVHDEELLVFYDLFNDWENPFAKMNTGLTALLRRVDAAMRGL